MPERRVALDDLQTGAYISGWLLTVWTLLAAVLSVVSLTVVGVTLQEFGYPRWVMPAALGAVGVLQLCGHIAKGNRRTLIAADIAGGLICFTGASLCAYATSHGDNSALCALGWGFVGCQFLLHAVMLRHP